MSILTFAVLTVVGLETGYANAYLENTSIAVMKVSKPRWAVILAIGRFV